VPSVRKSRYIAEADNTSRRAGSSFRVIDKGEDKRSQSRKRKKPIAREDLTNEIE
jgi:hypothetical protein